MTLNADDLVALAKCAGLAAERAGTWLNTALLGTPPIAATRKATSGSAASQWVTEADIRVESMILGDLAESAERYGIGVLSEEQPDTRARFECEHFWCIDPIDGTLPFMERSPGYAISVALVARDGTPKVGAVFDPVTQTSYLATRDQGLTRNGTRWTPRQSITQRELTVFFDRSFQARANSTRVEELLRDLCIDLGLSNVAPRIGAGAVMNAVGVLERAPACYFKLPKQQEGGGSLWDFAATACMFSETRAIATDIEGAPLDLNRADSTFMNHRGVLFASSPEIAQGVREIWNRIGAPTDRPHTEVRAADSSGDARDSPDKPAPMISASTSKDTE